MTRTDGTGLNLASESAPLKRREGTITLVEGSSFRLSDGRGDIQPNRPEGLFVGDTRILSRWQLVIDSTHPELLESGEIDPFHATFVTRHTARSSHPLLVVRSRRLLHGAIREQITVRNLGSSRCDAVITLAIGADFATCSRSRKESRRPRRFRARSRTVARGATSGRATLNAERRCGSANPSMTREALRRSGSRCPPRRVGSSPSKLPRPRRSPGRA
jgi:hypothetical protein